MQFDETRIAVRERDMFEILDLSLHVLRTHARPLLWALLIGVAPFAIVNHLLIGWMADVDYQYETAGKWRFTWCMMCLVFLEAPLATIVGTAYLGAAVFQRQPTLWQAIDAVKESWKSLLWVLVCVRGLGLGLLFVVMIPRRSDFNPLLEGFFLALVCLFVIVVRAVRPFTGEVVLLEKKPLRATPQSQVTVRQRSTMLHGDGGDLFMRWFGAAIIGLLLLIAFAYNFLFAWGTLLNEWAWGPFLLQVCVPMSMWMVAMYFCVVRFLCYLDQRIRYEGWEVELRLRAEARRLAERLA